MQSRGFLLHAEILRAGRVPMVDSRFVRWSGLRWTLPLAILVCGCAGKSERDPVKSETRGEAGAAGAPALVGGGVGGGGGGGGVGGVGGGVPIAAFASCQRHIDCVVTYRGCCPSCGDESLANMAAVSREEVASYHAASCGSEPPACRSCSSFSSPYLVARCVDGQCAASDLFQAPFNDCNVSEDCHLRSNTCCPCQVGASLISVSVAQEPQLRAQLCDAETTCDDCSSVSVTDVDTGCREGHCVLLFPF